MATAKKSAKSKPGKKAPARKPAPARKAPPRRKKPAIKNPPVKQAATRKPAAKKPVAKKSVAKKPVAKKADINMPTVRKAAPQRRPVVILSAVPAAPASIPRTKTIPAAVQERGPQPGEDPIGVVTHYYNHLSVAVVRLDTGSLEVGDTIRFLGHTTDFRQQVESLQVEHEPITEVGRKRAFGIKVKDHVREHDVVYKITAA